jgi:hypothetical protein
MKLNIYQAARLARPFPLPVLLLPLFVSETPLFFLFFFTSPCRLPDWLDRSLSVYFAFLDKYTTGRFERQKKTLYFSLSAGLTAAAADLYAQLWRKASVVTYFEL